MKLETLIKTLMASSFIAAAGAFVDVQVLKSKLELNIDFIKESLMKIEKRLESIETNQKR
jgi:hypothetical protein